MTIQDHGTCLYKEFSHAVLSAVLKEAATWIESIPIMSVMDVTVAEDSDQGMWYARVYVRSYPLEE